MPPLTIDRLERIYEDGETEALDICWEFYSPHVPDGETKMIRHNREFDSKVKQLGLM